MSDRKPINVVADEVNVKGVCADGRFQNVTLDTTIYTEDHQSYHGLPNHQIVRDSVSQ